MSPSPVSDCESDFIEEEQLIDGSDDDDGDDDKEGLHLVVLAITETTNSDTPSAGATNDIGNSVAWTTD